MKIIMILGITKELFPLVDIARENGYKVLATDRNPKSEGLEYVDIPVVLDSLDKELVLELATKYKIDAITTRTEMLLPTVSFICEKLDLLGPSSLVSSLSNDKYLFREFMAKAEIAVPDYLLVDELTSIEKVESELDYPFILKPVDYSGSGGVVLIENRSDFIGKKTESLSCSSSKRAIAEALLHGKEYSIETVSQNNVTHVVAITEKYIVGQERFVEDRHVIPANLLDDAEKNIKDEVIKMANAMDLNNCIGHTEVMSTPSGPVIIETASRPGGDNICFKLVELSTGINMYRNMFNLSVGIEVEYIATKEVFSGIQFITALNKNEIKDSLNSELEINQPDFLEYCFEDSASAELKQSADRLGHFICSSNDRETLIESLDFYK
jgi:biotin carboxylase